MAHRSPFLFVLLMYFSHFVHVSSKTLYIVRVDENSKPSLFVEAKHWYEATLETLRNENTDTTTTDHDPEPTTNTRQTLTHVYKTVFHGFSTQLTRTQAAKLSRLPGVIAVIPDRIQKLHTTRTPSFLGLYSAGNINNDYKAPGHLLNRSDSGSNVIIGFIDSGIWPEHVSFRDRGLGPIPPKWKGGCEEGQNFSKDNCNRKLIGARFFLKGNEAEFGILNSSEDFRSPRDSDGHGTHTASTAAGRTVGKAPLFDNGHGKGTAVGVAPKARIAVYKVCWVNGCADSDILSGIDKAVEDGVDIISCSIGSSYAMSLDRDVIAIGAFGAMEKGVFFSASAGNEGPDKNTTSNYAPRMTSVGASTIDRRFPADLVLGDGRPVFKGSSIYTDKPSLSSIPIIFVSNCTNIESLKLVRGKMVFCGEVDDYSAVMSAGAAAMVVIDRGFNGEDLQAYIPPWIPGLTVTLSTARAIFKYSNVKASISFHGMKLGIKPAPLVISWSSRGPITIAPLVMKPDLIAPGVNILAAYPYDESSRGQSVNPRQSAFYMMSGTSMACPHVSGVAALLKGAHPDWTPAMIRSAMMTTAYTTDNRGRNILDGYDYTNATVWAMGAGHVDPEKALDPGLVYDICPHDYVNFLCASGYSIEGIRTITSRNSTSCRKNQSQPWNLNNPAIIVDFKAYRKKNIVVKRTVMHVSECSSTYYVKVVNPKGVYVTVTPNQMIFNGKDDKQNYAVSIKAQNLTVGPGESTTDAGKLVWSDGKRNVVSPVVIMW